MIDKAERPDVPIQVVSAYVAAQPGMLGEETDGPGGRLTLRADAYRALVSFILPAGRDELHTRPGSEIT
jgi:hypothetical protein